MAQRTGRTQHWRAIWIRIAGAIAIVLSLLCILSDWFTEFWASHPMATAFVSGVLLIVVGGAVVNEYFANRARRQWQTVAALAVTQMRDGARGIGSSLGTIYGMEDSGSSSTLNLQAVAFSPAGDGESKLFEIGLEVLSDTERKDALAQEILVHIEAGQQVAATWAPVMINETSYVWVLDRYVSMLNRSWRVLWAIDDKDLRAGQEAPPDAAVATELADLAIDLVTFERDLTTMIRDLLPWPTSFGPAPSVLNSGSSA